MWNLPFQEHVLSFYFTNFLFCLSEIHECFYIDYIYFLFVALLMRSSFIFLIDIVCTYKGYLFLYISCVPLTYLIFFQIIFQLFLMDFSGKELYACNNDTFSSSFLIFIYLSLLSNCIHQQPQTILISYNGGKQSIPDIWDWEQPWVSHYKGCWFWTDSDKT